ncbi:MAG: succinate dehydrogenase, cytochrome b556 subunit [Pseudomonadota bacterium]
MSNTAGKIMTSAPPGAPLSPHLQIWRFTVTMAASITQRATGIANFTGTALIALWIFSVAQGREFFAPVGAILSSPIGMLIIFGYIWSLSFHMLGGLRYLYTDTGRGLDPATAKSAAWATYIGSFVLTAVIAFAAWSARGGA